MVDSWENLTSGINKVGVDPRLEFNPVLLIVDWDTAETMWRSGDLAARAVELIPYEEMREGFDVEGGDDANADDIETVEKKLDDLDVALNIYNARCYARAYGGGALLLGADDGQRDLSKPLNVDAIKSFDWINLLHPRELSVYQWYGDATLAKYGEPEIYILTPENVTGPTGQQNGQQLAIGSTAGARGTVGSVFVHESRIVRFDGTIVNKRQRRTGRGWGDSVFTRIFEELRDFDGAWTSTSLILNKFARTVFKMKDLADLVASEDPADQLAFRNRVRAAEYASSVLNAVFVDKDGEDVSILTQNVTGLPDVLSKFESRLSAALEIPVTKLFGISPGGLNATGESDIRNFYDRVKARQVKEIRKPLRYIVELAAKAEGIKLPENFDVRFRPLWQLDGLQEAQRRKTILEGTQIAISTGMITPEEGAVSHFSGESFNDEIKLQTDDREALAEERQQAEAEASQANAEEMAKIAKKHALPGAKPGGGKPPFGK